MAGADSPPDSVLQSWTFCDFSYKCSIRCRYWLLPAIIPRSYREPSWRRNEMVLSSKGDIRKLSSKSYRRQGQKSAFELLNHRWTYPYSRESSTPIPGLSICAVGRQSLHIVVVRTLGTRKIMVTSNSNGNGLEAEDMIPG